MDGTIVISLNVQFDLTAEQVFIKSPFCEIVSTAIT